MQDKSTSIGMGGGRVSRPISTKSVNRGSEETAASRGVWKDLNESLTRQDGEEER